jgi:hypothetical protein
VWVPAEHGLQMIADRTLSAGPEYDLARVSAIGRARPTTAWSARLLVDRAFAPLRGRDDGRRPAAPRPGPGKDA